MKNMATYNEVELSTIHYGFGLFCEIKPTVPPGIHIDTNGIWKYVSVKSLIVRLPIYQSEMAINRSNKKYLKLIQINRT